MMPKNRALGKGLAALLGDWQAVTSSVAAPQIQMLLVDDIVPGSYQPRQDFDEESLEALAQSIRSQGLMQPITVRPKDAKYEIIAGERRWRACKKIAKELIPAIVHQVSDEAALALGLIENLQRQNLNAIEEATALARLQSEFSMTHQDIANIIGQSRAHISNQLRLLQLELEVQCLVAGGQISVGHARCLIGLDTNTQINLAEKIHQQQWSVRMTEKWVQSLNKGQTPKAEESKHPLAEKLAHHWQAKFEIKSLPKNKGKMIIHYNGEEHLDRILNHLLFEAYE